MYLQLAGRLLRQEALIVKNMTASMHCCPTTRRLDELQARPGTTSQRVAQQASCEHGFFT
jgi:hypothetical protein